MKLNSRIHGIIDYLVVLFLWLSPTLFGLPAITSVFVYGLGAVHLALTICTNFEYGLVRFIQLKIHGGIELAVAIILVPVAFYLGNLEGEFARNFVLAFAVAVFVVWLLSDYHNKPAYTREIPNIDANTDGGMI